MRNTARRQVVGLVSAVALAGVLLASATAETGTTFTQVQYLDAMNKALDGVRAKTRAQPKAHLEFSANLFFAHEAMIEHISLPILIKYADALTDTGVHRIDINPGLFPWRGKHQPTIDKYDALIKHIRKSGVKLVFNPQYSAIHHKVKSFEEWEQAALEVYAELARRYQPDIFIVVHEPTTMAARMGAKVSPKAWQEFAQRAAQIVKAQSPRTRCGAGGLSWEKKYFNAFLKLDELDVMTLDIYNLGGLKTYNKMIQQAHKRGKPVYVEETWRPPYYVKQPGMTLEAISMIGIGSTKYADLDIKWLETITAYASTWNLEAITPFWTQTFFKYSDGDTDALDPEYMRQIVDAIDRGKRSETFHAYKKLITQWGKP